MNAHTGQWHLKRMIIRYSETAGSSLGVRFYFRHLLPQYIGLHTFLFSNAQLF